VLTLLDGTFAAHLEAHNTTATIVDFYATWCGHCQKLAPIYASAATTSKKLGHAVHWAKVDVDQAQDVSERFNVEGLPTIVAIKVCWCGVCLLCRADTRDRTANTGRMKGAARQVIWWPGLRARNGLLAQQRRLCDLLRAHDCLDSARSRCPH
jgi:hypothetical protein